MHFDDTFVQVYPRESNLLQGPNRTVREEWGSNVTVSYDSRIVDLREKRYGITIGKNVFEKYQRNEQRAIHDVTERVIGERKLCSKGWSRADRGITYVSGGIGWTVMCNGKDT